jgi:Replication-relaxation
MSRSQIQKLLNISNVRNMNRILMNMSKYLNSKRLHENVYYLNKDGRQYIGTNRNPAKPNQIEHKLMRSDMYMYYDFPDTWKPEHPIEWMDKKRNKKRIISDAFFSQDQTYFFVEVDHKQAMTKNMNKIDSYTELFPLLEKEYNVDCVLVFYTMTEARKKRLMKYCEEKGVTCGVFTKDDIV